MCHQSLSPDPPDAGESRKIIHIDMDAFYAAVEQRDNPALRGRPLSVGGSRERGVVAAASYEARRFGVRSAMSSVVARRRCPELVFVEPRFDVYKSISRQVRSIFADWFRRLCSSNMPRSSVPSGSQGHVADLHVNGRPSTYG